ncbi:MAG TPA: hypothetical protein VFA26_13315 [Gemmataceae bacterium]|nr:hypothetical protein [Gemmataceae bacterium]
MRIAPRHLRPAPRRRGVVLLSVLVVLVLLSLAAYQYSELMVAESRAADSYSRSAQAHGFAESGVWYAAALLSNPDEVATTLNGNPYNNPTAFQGVLVQDDANPKRRGRFSIIALADPDPNTGGVVGTGQGYYFGVNDESGRINLHSLLQLDSSGQTASTILQALPNVTQDVSDPILDWIDARTTDPRPSGAKNQYYGTQNPSYRAKSYPLDTLDELLLVKGITPQLLWGNDLNRNGTLDPGEDPQGTGIVDRGLSAYITLYSRELNVDSQGNPRVNVNDSNLDTLAANLSNAGISDDLVNYILAYRTYGGSSSGGGPGAGQGQQGGGAQPQPPGGGGQARPGGGGQAQPMARAPAQPAGRGDNDADDRGQATGGGGAPAGGGMAGGGSVRPSSQLSRTTARGGSGGRGGGGQTRIASLFDLVNSQVTIPSQGNNQPAQVYLSPMSDPSSIRQMLPTVLDKLTTVSSGTIPARVNVNTAPAAVLSALPGLQNNDSYVQAILSARPPLTAAEAPDPIFQTPAWLITEANLPVSTVKTMERYVTARSQVYRVQSVGYFDGGGPTARIEAVIDTNNGRPRILYWRDLTELGKAFDFTSQQQQQ